MNTYFIYIYKFKDKRLYEGKFEVDICTRNIHLIAKLKVSKYSTYFPSLYVPIELKLVTVVLRNSFTTWPSTAVVHYYRPFKCSV